MNATETKKAGDVLDDQGGQEGAAQTDPGTKSARKQDDGRKWRARQEKDVRRERARADRDARKPASPPPRRALPGRLLYMTTFIVAAIWLILDQATKVVAVESLPETGAPAGQFGPFDFRLVRNPGGAFGIPGFPALFLVVTVLVLILILRALPRTDRLSLAAAYGLVSGGALGNVTDRLARAGDPGFGSGHVIDFLDLGWWPVFNLADVGIVVGAVAIAILLTIVDREERAAEAARAEHRSVRPEGPPPPR